MKFAYQVKLLHLIVGQLIAVVGVQQAIKDRAMLANNATQDVLHKRQPHVISEALFVRVRDRYTQYQFWIIRWISLSLYSRVEPSNQLKLQIFFKILFLFNI